MVDGNATKAYQYYYDESGRLKKIDQGGNNYIKFHYDSDNLEYEEHYVNNSLSYIIKYFYDDQDKVQFALYKDRNFSTSTGYFNLYTYVYNGFGEITEIIRLRNGLSSSSPAVVCQRVARYEYDPYGNILNVSTYSSDTFGNINPIRYKGYYYDTDLGWYNLGSRYYDPSIGRFINCDDISLLTETTGDITDKNLYAYCDNNPIMRKDKDGEFWHIVAGGLIGAATEFASQMIAGEKINIAAIAVAGVGGAATATFGIAGGAIVSGLTSAVVGRIKNENVSMRTTIQNFAVGAGLSILGGSAGRSLTSGSDSWFTKSLNQAWNSMKNKKTLKSWLPTRADVKHAVNKWKGNNNRKNKTTSKWRVERGISSFAGMNFNIFNSLRKRYGH